MRIRATFALLALGSLLLLPGGLSAKGIDPRKVSVLYIGDPYPGVSPYIAMKEDAFIVVAPIRAYYHGGGAAPLQLVQKYMRTYMPRNYQELVENYDVVILSDAYRFAFTQRNQEWFKDSVIDDGIGLVMVAGLDSFWASSSRPDANWQGSPVEDVLPVWIPTGNPKVNHNWIRASAMEITDYSHEFISSLPYTPEPLYMRIPVDGQLVIQKVGAARLARWINHALGNPPLYVTWDVGMGRTYAMMHDWTGQGGEGGGYHFSLWEFYRDYAINLMLYLARRSLHPEYMVLHQYRELVHAMALGKGVILSLVDFVDKFGGNPRTIDEEIIVLDSMVADAQERYLDHDFDAALVGIRASLEKLKKIEELSVKIKDQALFWVYAVEWLSVTAVALLSGFALWSLMIRRRLYREVKATRLGARS